MIESASPQRGPIAAILTLSGVAVGFLFWLIYFKDGLQRGDGALSSLPAINASLNAASALSVVVGIAMIRRRKMQAHQLAMSAAFILSAAFLVCYIAYYSLYGNTVFTAQGWIRPVYFSILVSHILLSIVALPMILTTFYFSLTQQFERHMRLARWTTPIWLYVSVTGVVIYFLVKNFA